MGWSFGLVYWTIHCITLVSCPPVLTNLESSCMNSTQVTWLLCPPKEWHSDCNSKTKKNINCIFVTHSFCPIIYLWLRCRIGVQFHFSPIIAGGHKRSVEATTSRIHIGSISVFRPNADRLETQRTVLRRPVHVPHRRARCNLTTGASVPYIKIKKNKTCFYFL